MSITTSVITLKDLLSDETSASIGCWVLKPMIHGKESSIMIIEKGDGQYMVGLSDPGDVRTISTATTLKGAVSVYNNFVLQANKHDLMVNLASNGVNRVLVRR